MQSPSEFHLNPGRLTSLANLHHSLAPQLRNLGMIFQEGGNPRVIWDLRSAIPPYQSLAALTCLASICARVREVSGNISEVIYRKDPDLVRYWLESGFVYITSQTNCIQWQDLHAKPSPHSRTASGIRHVAGTRAPDESNLDAYYLWKDLQRNRYVNDVVISATRIANDSNLPFSAKQEITICAIELILNAVTHGNADAYYSIERQRGKLTVTVCDSGDGFRKSLRRKRFDSGFENDFDDLDAVFTACFVNREGAGLRRAIDFAVQNLGAVTISSGSGEIRWTQYNWLPLRKIDARMSTPNIYKLQRIRDYLPPPHSGVLGQDQYQSGYHHQHAYRLIGSRVSFDLPTQSQ